MSIKDFKIKLSQSHPREWEDITRKFIQISKNKEDSLGQIFGALTYAILQTDDSGSKKEILDKVNSLDKNNLNISFLRSYTGLKPPPKTGLLSSDAYGMYWAMNDAVGTPLTPLEKGNPIISSLFKMLYDQSCGDEVMSILKKSKIQPFKNLSVACVGFSPSHDFRSPEDAKEHLNGAELLFGKGLKAEKIKTLLGMFGKSLDYSPDNKTQPLTISTSLKEGSKVNYVITSNVLNHGLKHMYEVGHRDEIMAAGANLLKKGGKAIHLLEKSGLAAMYEVITNKGLSKFLGQKIDQIFRRGEDNLDQYLQSGMGIYNPDEAPRFSNDSLISMVTSTQVREVSISLKDLNIHRDKNLDLDQSLDELNNYYRGSDRSL